ncbi:MAG: lipocalin [Limimaricola sp.]|uniref:lipocalin family protein n=1 Tax=Limimaricola sp. TaxID=2211665 RepID=UPI001DEB5DBD|nr:lipocalin family protein [Limimaricola sp.]MBI1416262.1 lipocalin [Limimaricola sp.]
MSPRALLFALPLVLAGCAIVAPSYRDASVPIASRAVFDPSRYLGLWHEVARYPVVFENGCTDVTAEYTQRDDGLIGVHNICRKADGTTRDITGTAEVAGPGRLKVRFPSVPFVAADYWVLWVAEDYGTAVVGAPNGRSGWILNRTPTITPDRLAAAREVLDFNGYDLSKLEVLSP